jgi:hypothetical protein
MPKKDADRFSGCVMQPGFKPPLKSAPVHAIANNMQEIRVRDAAL